MILGFRTTHKGRPTGFVEKINSGQKIHTLREDKNQRWRAGRHIEFATGVRTKQYSQFKNDTCKSTQRVFMSMGQVRLEISIDDTYLYPPDIKELAINDGFDTVEDFYNWFVPLVQEAEKDGKHGLPLRLIHWTDKRY
ncbi:hypothetical protein [Spirosoma radiotolerans]|uniref:ASCH domain-containing protein n=1 Tax=Spirosoma radiotolerans TaxID=1379870 RepID=A0A0E3ZTK5_9BACT|nr:hypothetical protein [Spirosoma radiotolerans]AKD55048.1 hypothetical protein SD10_09155 [Spirosoma radiotolerans]